MLSLQVGGDPAGCAGAHAHVQPSCSAFAVLHASLPLLRPDPPRPGSPCPPQPPPAHPCSPRPAWRSKIEAQTRAVLSGKDINELYEKEALVVDEAFAEGEGVVREEATPAL